MKTENRQEHIKYVMIFMLGGLWAAQFCYGKYLHTFPFFYILIVRVGVVTDVCQGKKFDMKGKERYE